MGVVGGVEHLDGQAGAAEPFVGGEAVVEQLVHDDLDEGQVARRRITGAGQGAHDQQGLKAGPALQGVREAGQGLADGGRQEAAQQLRRGLGWPGPVAGRFSGEQGDTPVGGRPEDAGAQGLGVAGQDRAQPPGPAGGGFQGQAAQQLGFLEQAADPFAEVAHLGPRFRLEDLLPVGFFLVQFVVVADEGDGKDAARHQQREPMAAQGVEHPCRCRAAYHRLSWVGVSGGSVGETPSAYPLTGDAGRS